MFEVVIKPRAEKEFKNLDRGLRERIYKELEKLSLDPFLALR